MNIKTIIATFFVALILVSCSPTATSLPPTDKSVPVSTFTLVPTKTSIPPTATITPTPVPETLATAAGLDSWVKNYTLAYGGMVTVNGNILDAAGLAALIREDSASFLQTKIIDGTDYEFLVVNGVPLAYHPKNGMKWEKETLSQLASAQNFYVGNILSDPYAPDMELRDQLNKKEFNFAHIETTDGSVTEPSQGKFDYSSADQAVQLALDNSMYVAGGSLIYGAADFEWGWPKSHVTFDPNGKLVSTDLTNSQLTAGMVNHIQNVMAHFQGKVSSWEVVNESCLKAWHPGKWDPYVEILGEGYIETAFTAARQAAPNAILIYNQNSNETMGSDRYQMTRDIVRRLRSKNLIDTVGLQMHVNQNEWKPPSKQAMIQAFKSYGIPVAITELDVNMSYAKGDVQEQNIIQAGIYKDIFTACLDSGVCHEINFWGVGDKYSWYVNQQNIPNARPTILNDDLSPKLAYYAITQVLYEHLP